MKLVETERRFLIKPKGLLHYQIGECEHRKYHPEWGNCGACIVTLGDNERVGINAVFETDELTFSKLHHVYFEIGEKLLRCDVSQFNIIRELEK